MRSRIKMAATAVGVSWRRDAALAAGESVSVAGGLVACNGVTTAVDAAVVHAVTSVAHAPEEHGVGPRKLKASEPLPARAGVTRDDALLKRSSS